MTAYSVSTDLGRDRPDVNLLGGRLAVWRDIDVFGVRCIRFDRVMVLEGICDKGAGISWRKAEVS